MALNIVRKIDGAVAIRRVLVSAFDKSGLDSFIPGLLKASPGLQIYSTGGTFTALQKILGDKAGGCLHQVSDYTGQPEMQGGLVKTLDYKIYLGLLSETYNPDHTKDLERAGAFPLDMVVVNLYPFQKTVQEPGATAEEARTNIDIGGPCMIRAAAKNYLRAAAVTDPADYPGILAEMKNGAGRLGLATRFRLAQKAFAATAAYDQAIASYLKSLDFPKAAGCYEIKG